MIEFAIGFGVGFIVSMAVMSLAYRALENESNDRIDRAHVALGECYEQLYLLARKSSDAGWRQRATTDAPPPPVYNYSMVDTPRDGD